MTVGSALVMDSVASRNGRVGFDLTATTAFHGNQLRQNTNGSVLGGKPTGGNFCGDGSCSTSGLRRYYLTSGTTNGASATTACAPGFHMASLWEISDTSALFYDRALGVQLVGHDLGEGPPAAVLSGWIRTGYAKDGSSPPLPGRSNCEGWSASAEDRFGSVGFPSSEWNAFAPRVASPWEFFAVPCNAALNVWCVED